MKNLFKIAVFSIIALGNIIPAAAANKLKELVVYTPPIGIGVLAVDALKSRNFKKYVQKATAKIWNTPDKLRAGIIDGSIDITFIPSYVGANLYNKGIEFQLINIVTGGLLNIISTDSRMKTIADLKGKTIVVPFPNDMPDLVLRTLFKRAGMKVGKDVYVEYVSTPAVAVKMALAEKAQTILLPEIAGTKLSLAAKEKKGINFRFAIDIQEEWGRLMGGKSYIPQAGLAVRKSFANKYPEIICVLHRELVKSANRLRSNKKYLWNVLKNYGQKTARFL